MPSRRPRDDDYDDEDEPRQKPRRINRDEDDRSPRRPRDDDEPRSHRREHREDEDDRSRRRRVDEEDDYDDRRRRKRRRLAPSKLRTVAIRQKILLFCILGYLIAFAAQFVIPEHLRIIVGIPGLAIALTATVFVFLLAMEIHGTGMGILFGLLTLLPCVGLIILLIVNQQATSLLQKNGVRVSLLGANMSDIP